MSQNTHPIQIHDMTIAYHKKPVLWDVDLDVPEGQLVGSSGPNGAGKSTMIKAVMDLVPKASGWVKIYGKDYGEMRKIIGYVPPRESVDWDFTISALAVVLLGRSLRRGRCGDGAGYCRYSGDLARAGQDDPGRPPRFADGHRIFQLGHHAQYAGRGLWSDS